MTNEYTIHEDARHRGEMCRMLSGRIAELETENRRLTEDVRRLRMRYCGCGDELVKGKLDVARYREALETVEWIEMPDGFGGTETEYRCPWCDGEQFQGHASDCQRLAALEATECLT